MEVDQKDMRRVMKRLKGAEIRVPRVFRNSVNRTATRAMRKIREGRSDYTVQAGVFNSAINVYRASADKITATIKAKDKTHGLGEGRYYKTSTSKKFGTRAKVLKAGGLKELVNKYGNKAFVAGVQTGHAGVTHVDVFQRTEEKGRLPIKKLQSVGVSKMVEMIYEGKHGRESMKPFIQKTLREELQKELAKLT